VELRDTLLTLLRHAEAINTERGGGRAVAVGSHGRYEQR
jgi:hypothetical protein